MNGVQVRAMQADDLYQVVINEEAAYEFPWSQGIFEDCLQVGYPCWVAEDENEQILGHAIMTLSVGEAHVLNICVHPHFHGQGLGQRLLDTMLEYAFGEAAMRMFLEVRASNHAAIRLYQSNDFVEVGLRKGYYPAAQGREDGVVLRRDF